ncbi:MAG: TadE/TadG family type IV pilus assembly protein [Paracoccaceae bacterium]
MRGVLTFLHDDRGSQTIEVVLWIPIFVALLVIIIDASMLYLTQTEMWNVARDTARRMTTGALATPAEAEAYANTQLNLYSNNSGMYTVTASDNPVVQVAISVGAGDISFTGFAYLGFTIFGGPIRAQVVMRPQPT